MNSLKDFILAIKSRKKLIDNIPLPFIFGGVTALITYFRHIPKELFLEKWLYYYGLVLLIVIPFKIIIETAINLLIDKHLQEKRPLFQGLVFGLAFFGLMSTVMTGVAVFSFNSIENIQQFSSLLLTELNNNIPIVLSIIIIVGGIIKPVLIKRNLKKNPPSFC